MAEMITTVKKCTRCGVEKPISAFGKHKACKDGINTKCKECNTSDARSWYEQNAEKAKLAAKIRREAEPDKYKEKSAEYYRNNSENIKSSVRIWRSANSGKVKSYGDKWIAKNKEKIRINTLLWRRSNPDKSRIQVQNRRTKCRKNGGKLSKNIVKKLFSLQRGKCPCCGLSLGRNYHIDHIIPIALGGTNTDDNVQLLRQRCNNQKHAKHPVEFMQQRGFLL